MQALNYQTDTKTEDEKVRGHENLDEIGAESDLDSNRILYKRDAADVARVSSLYTMERYVVARVHVAFSRPNDAVATLTLVRPLCVGSERKSRRVTALDTFGLSSLKIKRDKSEIVTLLLAQANLISQLDDYMSTRAIISAALSSH